MGAGESTAASCSSLDLARAGQMGSADKSPYYRRNNRQLQLLHEQKLQNRQEQDFRPNSMGITSPPNDVESMQAYKLTNADLHGISRAQVMGKPVPMPGLHLASAAKKSNAGVASRILHQRQQQRFCELKKFSDSLPSLNHASINISALQNQQTRDEHHERKYNHQQASLESANHPLLTRTQSSQQANLIFEQHLHKHRRIINKHQERSIPANSNLVMNRASNSHDRQSWQTNQCYDEHAKASIVEKSTRLMSYQLHEHHRANRDARCIMSNSNEIKRATSLSSLHNLNQGAGQLNHRHHHPHRIQTDHQNRPHQGHPRNSVLSDMVNPLTFSSTNDDHGNEFDVVIVDSSDANNERLAPTASRPCHRRIVKSPQLAPPAAMATSYCRPVELSNCALSRQTAASKAGAIKRDLGNKPHHLTNCSPKGVHRKAAAPLPPVLPTRQQQHQQCQQINHQLRKNHKYKQIASNNAQSAKNNRYNKLYNQREQQQHQQGCPVLPPLPRSQSLHELVQLRATENGQRMRTTGTLRNPSGAGEQAGKVNLVAELLEKRRHVREVSALEDTKVAQSVFASDIKKVNDSETMLSQSSSSDDGIHDVSLAGETIQNSINESQSRQDLSSSSNEENSVSSRGESNSQKSRGRIFKKQQVAAVANEKTRLTKLVGRKSSAVSGQARDEPSRSSARQNLSANREEHKSSLIRSVSHSALHSVGSRDNLPASTSHSQDGDESDDLNELAQFLYKFKHRQLQAKASQANSKVEAHKLKDDDCVHHEIPSNQGETNLQQSPNSTTSSSGFASSTCTSKSVSSSEGGNSSHREKSDSHVSSRPSFKKYPAPPRPGEAPPDLPDSTKTKKFQKSKHVSSLLSIVDEYQANLSQDNSKVSADCGRRQEQYEHLQKYAQSRQISQSELALNQLTSSPALLDEPKARVKSKCKNTDCGTSLSGSENSGKPHKPYTNRLLNLIRRRVSADKSELTLQSSDANKHTSSSAGSAGGHFHQINRHGQEPTPGGAIHQIGMNIRHSCSTQADSASSSSSARRKLGDGIEFDKTPSLMGLRKCSAISESLCDLNFDSDFELIKSCGQLANERTSRGQNKALSGNHQARAQDFGVPGVVQANRADNINQPVMSIESKTSLGVDKRLVPVNNSSSSATGSENNWRLATASASIGLATDERLHVFNHDPSRARSDGPSENKRASSAKSSGSLNKGAGSAGGGCYGGKRQTKPSANDQQCDQHPRPVRKCKWSASAWLLGGGGDGGSKKKKSGLPSTVGSDEIRQSPSKSYLARLISNSGMSASRDDGERADSSRHRDNNTDGQSVAQSAQNDLISEADQLLGELDHSLDMVSASANRVRADAKTLPWWRQVSSESGCKEALEQVSQIDAFRDGIPLASDDSDNEADHEVDASDDGDYASLNRALINETFDVTLDQECKLNVEPAGSPSDSFTFSAPSSPTTPVSGQRLMSPLIMDLEPTSPPPPQIACRNIHLELERLKNGAPTRDGSPVAHRGSVGNEKNTHPSSAGFQMVNVRENLSATCTQVNDPNPRRNGAASSSANQKFNNATAAEGQRAHNVRKKSECVGKGHKELAEIPTKGASIGKTQQQVGDGNNSSTFAKSQPAHNGAALAESRVSNQSSNGLVKLGQSTISSADVRGVGSSASLAQQATALRSKGCCVSPCSGNLDNHSKSHKISPPDLVNLKSNLNGNGQSNVQERHSNLSQQPTVRSTEVNALRGQQLNDTQLQPVKSYNCQSVVKARATEQAKEQAKLEDSINHSVYSIHGHSTCCTCRCSHKPTDLTTHNDQRQEQDQKRALCTNNASSACHQSINAVLDGCDQRRVATKTKALHKSTPPLASNNNNEYGDKFDCSCSKERNVLSCQPRYVDAASGSSSERFASALAADTHGRKCSQDDESIIQSGGCGSCASMSHHPSAHTKFIVTANCLDGLTSNGGANDETMSPNLDPKMMSVVQMASGREVPIKASSSTTHYHHSQKVASMAVKLAKPKTVTTDERRVGRESSQAKSKDQRSSGSEHLAGVNHNDDCIPSKPSECRERSNDRSHLTPSELPNLHACNKNNGRAVHTNHHAKCHANGALEMPASRISKACEPGAPSTACQDNNPDCLCCAPLVDHRQLTVMAQKSGALPSTGNLVAANIQASHLDERSGNARILNGCDVLCRSNSELAVPQDQLEKSKRPSCVLQTKRTSNLLFGRLRNSLLNQKGNGAEFVSKASTAKLGSSQLSLVMNCHESSHLAAAMLMANCKQQRADRSGRNSAASEFDDNFILRRKTPNAGLKSRC